MKITLREKIITIGFLFSVGCTAQDFIVDDIGYNRLANNTVEVTAKRSMHYVGDVTIPKKVEYNKISYEVVAIADDAFSSNTNLTSVNIEAKLKRIGNSAFSTCTSLKEINIPKSTSEIGKYAFRSCKMLGKIELPQNITTISECCFTGCTSLTNIVIPNGVTKIDFCAFRGCTQLSSVVMPSSLSVIADKAFKDCHSLKSIHFPKTLNSIGTYCFEECTDIESLHLPKTENIGEGAFSGCTGLRSVTIQEGTHTIPLAMFANCTNLNSVVMPNSIVKVGRQIFIRCTNLKNVTLPNHLTEISNGMFSGCASLKSVKLPESVTEIKANAFYNSGLERMFIPAKVAQINNGAFNGCKNLSVISVDENNDFFTSDEYVLYNKDRTKLIYAFGHITEFDTPESVTEISHLAFANHEELRKVRISKNVKIIKSRAFSPCDNIQEFWVDERNANFKTIGNVLFNKQGTEIIKAYSLKGTYQVPDSVIEIMPHAFSGNDDLTEVIIGNHVETIDACAFARCKQLKKITIPASVVSIKSLVFYNCTNLEKIEIDKANPMYCTDNNIMYNKSRTTLFKAFGNKEKYNIAPTVTSIQPFAFEGCNKLSYINIPASTSKFGEKIFESCSNLQNIKVNWIKPFYMPISKMFSNSTMQKAILIVPDMSVQKYRENEFWGQFKYIEPDLNQ